MLNVSIICVTKNCDFKIVRQIKSLLFLLKSNPHFIYTLIIDGKSDENLELVSSLLLENQVNFQIVQTLTLSGKVKAFIQNKNNYIASDYFLLLDDKDYFSSTEIQKEIFIKSLKNLEENIYFLYYKLSPKKVNIIGDKIQNNESYFDFRFKKGKTGDHVYIMKNTVIQKMELPVSLDYVAVNDELFLFVWFLNENEISLLNEAVFVHDYKEGSITKNILEYKKSNSLVTKISCETILSFHPKFNIRIAKLFELSLIKNEENIKLKNGLNKILFFLINLRFVNFYLKKIYLKKIGNLMK